VSAEAFLASAVEEAKVFLLGIAIAALSATIASSY
jgi:hypothetical protein